MPRTGKSVVWKMKAICTILLGFAVQRDITRTREAHLIHTCSNKGNDNSEDNKTGHKRLILLVPHFHAFQVNNHA
jgi:hypothetical protein